MKTAEVTEFNGINTNCVFQLPVLYFNCRGSHSKYRTARGSHKQEYENHLFEKKNVTFFPKIFILMDQNLVSKLMDQNLEDKNLVPIIR